MFRAEDLAQSGELRNIEWEIRDKADRRHVLLVNVKKVAIKEGTVLYTCRDITDRKETQEQLREAKETAEAANRSEIMKPQR